MTALFTFLGGSTIRMFLGWLFAWLDKKQDQANELARMKLQGELDNQQHANNMEAIRVQAELGVKTIQVQGEIDIEKLEAAGFLDAAKEAMKPTGIMFVDAWNGIIRPLAASIAIILWVNALNVAGWKMSEWDKELVGVILGFFFASRVMQRSGK